MNEFQGQKLRHRPDDGAAEKAVRLVGEKLADDFRRVASNEPHATVDEVALLMASAYSTALSDDAAGQAAESGTPVADALAEVDRRQNTSGQNGELTALRALAEAVRVSLIAFPEGDVRTLAVTALELDYEFDSGDMLSAHQREVLARAHKLFGEGSR